MCFYLYSYMSVMLFNITCGDVHYSNGCGRTGTFITIYYTIERLKVEGLVDIFQAVKNCRIRRTGVVANLVRTRSSLSAYMLNV